MSPTRIALQRRAERAIAGLYHLATPSYPREFGPFADDFDSWLSDFASLAIDDVNAGPVAEMFGRVYSWGRGGRTVAPESVIEERGGGSFRLTAAALEDWSAADLTRGVRILESFAADVAAWNRDIPRQWAEYTAERVADESALAAASIAESRAGALNLLQDWRKIRDAGIEAPAVCATLRRTVAHHRSRMAAGRAALLHLTPCL